MELYRVGQLRRGGKRSRIRNFERRLNVDDTPRAETRASTNWPGNTKFVRELYAYVTRRLSFHRLPLPVSTRQHHPPSYGASGVTTERGKNILLRKGGWNTTLSPLSFSIIDGVERELQENSVTYTQLVLRLPRAHNSRGEARPVVHRTKVES